MQRSRQTETTSASNVEHALTSLSTDALCEVLRELLRDLDQRQYATAVVSIVDRASRTVSGWMPDEVSEAQVAEVVMFVAEAKRVWRASPAQFDDFLLRGHAAFLRKDYVAAHRIHHALLSPLTDGAIDLGQQELADEVLGADLDVCAAQLVVCTYMTTPLERRAEAVHEAIDEVSSIAWFGNPLRSMERAAIEPLPEWAEFLPLWRARIESEVVAGRIGRGGSETVLWLREVVERLEGADGLAGIARASCRGAEDAMIPEPADSSISTRMNR